MGASGSLPSGACASVSGPCCVNCGHAPVMVCTKDGRTFNARMKEYQDEIAAMRL